jgi:hypothetical protein
MRVLLLVSVNVLGPVPGVDVMAKRPKARHANSIKNKTELR